MGPVGEIDVARWSGQGLVGIQHGQGADREAAIGFHAGELVFVVENQEVVAARLLQQFLGRPAAAHLVKFAVARIQNADGRSERTVDRRGAQGQVKPAVAGIESHLEHVRQDGGLKKAPAQPPRAQVDLVDLPIRPAGNVKQVVLRIQGRGVVAVGGEQNFADPPLVREIDDVQAGMVVVGNVKLIPFFVVAHPDAFRVARAG